MFLSILALIVPLAIVKKGALDAREVKRKKREEREEGKGEASTRNNNKGMNRIEGDGDELREKVGRR